MNNTGTYQSISGDTIYNYKLQWNLLSISLLISHQNGGSNTSITRWVEGVRVKSKLASSCCLLQLWRAFDNLVDYFHQNHWKTGWKQNESVILKMRFSRWAFVFLWNWYLSRSELWFFVEIRSDSRDLNNNNWRHLCFLSFSNKSHREMLIFQFHIDLPSLGLFRSRINISFAYNVSLISFTSFRTANIHSTEFQLETFSVDSDSWSIFKIFILIYRFFNKHIRKINIFVFSINTSSTFLSHKHVMNVQK